MKLSREWLNDYVDCLDLSPQAFNDLITTKVAEVDAVHSLGAPLRTGVICHVVSVSDHPERKTLKVATIDIGGAPVQVVCGAPNCRAGMNTVYLPPGSTAISADGVIAVEKRAIGGVESAGMLASEYELELSGDHSGIIEIAAAVKPGTAATAHFGDGDVVLEIDNKSLTHRPDLWSHLGFARELAALLQRPMKLLPDMWADSANEGRTALAELKQGKANIDIQVDADTKCRRFLGVEIANLTPSPSPLWIRRRLFAVGAGVRNLLVDLSNYVMHDVGQPTHTYDADKLTGKTLH
ncbi:MAG: hypothetical protein IT290_04555, partial [Deltaproteobacteria bacterium]|nr:hypothetical protein [Deltaproteobacteria bacterium]